MCYFVMTRGWNQYRRNERNALFNDALDAFYLQLYDVDHLDSARGNPFPLLFPISSNVYIPWTYISILTSLNKYKLTNSYFHTAPQNGTLCDWTGLGIVI